MIGTTLAGRYQVLKALSIGGFAQTYIVEDTHRPGNPQYVLKHLKPANNSPEILETARGLFNREARVLEKLGKHPQIPWLFTYFEDNEAFYLVQELIEGHPLSAELPLGKRWSETKVKAMLEDVLGILEFVHAQGVIHRDIKPENIMRRESDNKLVLIDFWAIKEVRNEGIPQTATVIILPGTPGYMPAEQGQGNPKASSDLYALGMVAIQALTGMLPSQLREDEETGEIHWRDQANVSPDLAAVLSQMIRSHFRDRYQSATEVLAALRSLDRSEPYDDLSEPYDSEKYETYIPTQVRDSTYPETELSDSRKYRDRNLDLPPTPEETTPTPEETTPTPSRKTKGKNKKILKVLGVIILTVMGVLIFMGFGFEALSVYTGLIILVLFRYKRRLK